MNWTLLRRRHVKPDLRFDLAAHLYLVEVYAHLARDLVLYKAGQVGASEYLVSYALWSADERKATVLYVFPTDTHVSDFSSARIGPAIEASPYLQGIVVDGAVRNQGRKRGADRVTLKRVRDRFVYLRGSQVNPKGQAPQLKSVDADVVIYDEVDEMDPRALALGVKRLGHSALAEQRFVSTPTYPNFGIHNKWLESDQREWQVRCGACGEWQAMTIHQVVVEWDDLERPVAWHGQDEGRAFVACRKCGKELDRLAPGQWVAAYPEREVVGFHLTKLCSPTANLLDVVKALDTTDESKRKETFNQDLAEPYVPKGGQITDDVLDACLREYAHGPLLEEETYMGVDVGKALHVVIRGQVDAETGEWPQRWAGEVESFEALGHLMLRFQVRTAIVDALPETRKAREFQADFAPGRVWLAYYATQAVGLKQVEPARWDHEQWTVSLDRTRSLDATFSGFYVATSTLPANARGIRDYYDHLKAPVRVVEKRPNGEPVARYVEVTPDHYGHAENYCRAALKVPLSGWSEYARKKAEEMKRKQNEEEIR